MDEKKVIAVVDEVKAVKKAAEKKLVKKAEAVKKTVKKAEKTETKKTTKKEPMKETVHLQFAGKSYTHDQLINIVKDVWTYDLKKKPSELKSVDLYVKPEECAAYYVINGNITGSFYI